MEADEGAAFGAAVLAGVGAGVWASVDEACEKTVRVTQRVEPDKISSEILNRSYEAYRLLYNALRPAVKIIAGN